MNIIIAAFTFLITFTFFKVRYGKQIKELQKIAFTDSLTGVYNRRYFDNFIENIKSKKTGESLLLALFDIDHFKMVNDTYGHNCGDQALKHLSAAVNNNIRSSDILVRTGGEEFAIFMPSTKLECGITIAERIREIVEESKFIYNDVEVPLTISMGLSILKGESIEEFIEQTDKALYSAKRTGRNRLVVWEEVS